MRKINKFITVILALVVGCVATACVGKVATNNGESIDYTKSQFYISAYDAGYGHTWLDMYKQKFEEKYAEHSFESGKKGVQVVINWNQDANQALISSMKMSENSLFFNSVNYFDLAASGNAMSLDEIIGADLAEFGEPGKTSVERYPSELIEYYKVYDNHVYALPMHETYNGVSYDVDLFEERGFFFASEPNQPNAFTTGLAGAPAKSKGPDGKPGTYDDGLPATVAQFEALLNKIVNSNVTPFTFYRGYADFLTEALWYNFEGKEQIELNFTFDGVATDIVSSIDQDGNIVGYEKDAGSDVGLTITDQNAYKLQKQAGIYNALKTVHKIVNNDRTAANNRKYFSTKAWEGDQTHLTAQEEYLYSNVLDGRTPIAMFIEGTYWQQESRGVFEAINSRYGTNDEYSIMSRKFAFMPMPFLTADEVGTRKNTVMSNTAICFARAGQSGAELDMTKKFLMMINTEDMLFEYLKSAGFPRSMIMSNITDEQQRAQLTPFARSLLDVKANCDIVYTGVTTNRFVLSNSSGDFQFTINRGGWFFNSSLGAQPIINFRNTATLTAKAYFDGMYTNFEQRWSSIYNRYYK